MDEIFLGSGNSLMVQTSKNVELRNTLVVVDNNNPIELDIKIIADFSSIPEKYHEIFLNAMTVKFYDKVSFGDNPFSKCVPFKKKRWYQFWK